MEIPITRDEGLLLLRTAEEKRTVTQVITCGNLGEATIFLLGTCTYPRRCGARDRAARKACGVLEISTTDFEFDEPASENGADIPVQPALQGGHIELLGDDVEAATRIVAVERQKLVGTA